MIDKSLREAIVADDTALCSDALAQLSTKDPCNQQELLNESMREAVQLTAPLVLSEVISRGGDIRKVDQRCVPHHTRSPRKIIQVLGLLVAHGWDINQCNGSGARARTSTPAMWSFVTDVDIVKWCLDHGASVHARGEAEPTPASDWLRCPTILEETAGYGTVQTFELLRQRGAPLGTRPLQAAVETATHPAQSQNCSHAERMAMVRHLVETLKLDVNASDEFGVDGRRIPGRCGTVLDYAFGPWSLGRDNTELVMYLVRHGADVTDALGYAKADGLERTVLSLEAWMSRPSAHL